MNRKALGIASLLVAGTLLAVSVAVAGRVPADAQLPIHWGLDGQPDGFAGKWTALLLPPGLVAAISALFWFLPSLEPRRQGLERSQGLYLWGWTALLMMGSVIEAALVSEALGWAVPADRLIAAAVGTMLVMIGNQLGKSRSMYLIGFRTPWTLASEEVWIRTHRLAGKLMVAGGLAMVLAALLALPPGAMAAVAGGAVAVAAGVPLLYSYVLWRKERAAQPSE